MAFLNQTFDDTGSQFQYQGTWTLNGAWNAPSLGESGTLSSSNDANASVDFTFPSPAIAFYYYGMLRSQGGLYQICIDCDATHPDWILIDALNLKDNGQNPPVILFSRTFNTASVHRITIRNQNDTRVVPTGNSQITIDRIVLEVGNPNAPPPLKSSPPATTFSASSTSAAPSASSPLITVNSSLSTLVQPTSTTSVISGATIATSVDSRTLSTVIASTLQGDPTNHSPSAEAAAAYVAKPPVAPITIGTVLGSMAFIAVMILLGYWRILRSRKRSRMLTSLANDEVHADMVPAEALSGPSRIRVLVSPYTEPISSPFSSKNKGLLDNSTNAVLPPHKGDPSAPIWGTVSSHSHSQPSFSAASMPASSVSPIDITIIPVSERTRREIDGGPWTVTRSGDQNEGVEVLPPAYGQIFGRSRRTIRSALTPNILYSQPSEAVVPGAMPWLSKT